MSVTKFNLKRLRYLFPVLLAGLCLGLAVTLTAALERSRAGTERAAKALGKVQRAAELVSELRVGSAEHLAVRAGGLHEEWRRLEVALNSLGPQEIGGSIEGLREQVRLTGNLFDSALQVVGPGAGKSAGAQANEIALESSAIWAGWHRVEGVLTRRLIVELNGPGDQAPSVALLAALGCFCCAILLWQTSRSSQLRSDAATVETQLRDSESRYRAMAESSCEILVQADAAGKILRSNRKLSAATMGALFDSSDTWNRGVEALRKGSANAGAPREVWLAGSDSGRLVEWRASPVRDDAGNLVRVDSALLDITSWYAERQSGLTRIATLERNLRRLQLQLRELLDQSFELAESRSALKRAAEARMEALLTWSTRVSEPLFEASSVAQRIRNGSGMVTPGDSAVLAEAVQSMAASLQALAGFAGLERGPLQLVPAPFAPHALLEECLETVAERAEVKHLELPCFVDQDVPSRAVADVRRLREALGHALEHAIAKTECGEVSVRLTTASRSAGTLNLRFEIEDTGAGFTPDDLVALLEPFYPALLPGEVASPLAIAKKLVERMGGQFGAESEPGHGTRIWFVVPAEPCAAPVAGEEPLPSGELAGKRVLIMVDAASQRGALVELARTLGLAATASASTPAALTRLGSPETIPFEFVLVDYEMMGTGGAELTAWLARNRRPPGPEVYLMVPPSLRALTLADCPAGLSGVIAKPVRRLQLANLLAGRPPVEEPTPAAPSPGGPPAIESAAWRNRERREPVNPAAASSPIVLVVEDNLVNQRVAVRLVEKMGYRTAVVNNGLEAIQAFRRDRFDVILMDCQMPELDGFTATAEIRRLENSGSHLPIIAMTANAMRGDREKCIAAGMDDYISKPVAFEDLRVLIARWLARAAATRH